jgi:Mn-dependent DtxR family transcriptional regulator
MEVKKEDYEDLKALLLLLLRANKVDNEDIAKALGVSGGRISQMLDANKYPRRK